MDADSRTQRFRDYTQRAATLLGHRSRRLAFCAYVTGLMSNLSRKTAEGVAALFADESSIEAMYQRVQQFVSDSPWEDAPLRAFAAEYGLKSLPEAEPVVYWIVDDTGFLKKGNHSVGVQRQYTGTSGKIDNCQLGVSLCAATDQRQQPLDFRLYLPESWVSDPARRRIARVPKEIEFKTKPQLAGEMIKSASERGFARGVVLADCAYGNNSGFRSVLDAGNLPYSVCILGSTKMWRLDHSDKRRGRITSAESISRRLKFRRCTWTEGTKRQLASRFAFARVVVRNDIKTAGIRPVWLGVEHPYDEEEDKEYFLSTLPPSSTIQQRVLTHKARWRTERMYQDLKGVFGLDHYEGRSYRGWNHHVTAAMVAYSFAFAEQARLFPPQAPGSSRGRANSSAPGATLPRLDRDYGTARIWCVARLTAAMSDLQGSARQLNITHEVAQAAS